MDYNKIIHGDCVEIMKTFPNNSIDLIVTDPPYNVGKAEWDVNVLDVLENAAKECSRILKNEGQMYWFVPTRHLLTIGNLINQYIPYRWMFVWNTPNNMLTGDIGFSKYTSILIFSRAKSVYKNMQDLKSISWRPVNIDHPTPKPTSLIQYLISKSSSERDLVLDPFLGSGTTAVVCQRLNRHYLGIEINERYYNLALSRLEREKKQTRLLEQFC